MKNLLIALLASILLFSCNYFTNGRKYSTICDSVKSLKPISNIKPIDYKAKVNLKIGDYFYFGYGSSINLYRVVDFNKEGVFAAFSFQGKNDNASEWFGFKELATSPTYKKLTK